MARIRWPLLAALTAGCPGAAPSLDPAPAVCEDAPTWHAFAGGFVTTWCTPCHSASLSGPARNGAPDGLDFDRWSEVVAVRDRVAVRATGPSPTMPPLGGVAEADVALFARWLACGAPGEDDPPGPCDARHPGPAAIVATQADADALCAAGNTVPTLTVSGTASIGCLCSVDGSLVVTGGALDAPLLDAVGGDLVITGADAVRLPELRDVGGAFTGGGATAELSVPALASVGGDVGLTGLTALTALDLPGLVSVGGAFTTSDAGALARIDLPRLRTVGGSATFERLPALVALDGTRAFDAIGGDLVLSELTSLPVLDDWAFLLLQSVGGDVVVADNPSLVAIHGLTTLAELPGALSIERNAALVRVEGLDNLVHVGGDVRFRGNDRQESVLGLINLEQVDGALVLEDLPALGSVAGFEALALVGELRLARVGVGGLSGFPALVEVTGDLTLDGSPRLQSIAAFAELATVGGDLTLRGHALLSSIDGLHGLGWVGGGIEVRDNPSLPTSVIDGWVAGIGAVGGPVVVSGNGPG